MESEVAKLEAVAIPVIVGPQTLDTRLQINSYFCVTCTLCDHPI